MPVPDCDFGKCIIAPLHGEKITLEKENIDVSQALSAGTVRAEDQGAMHASREAKLVDIDRLNLEIEINIPKVCSRCPYRRVTPMPQVKKPAPTGQK